MSLHGHIIWKRQKCYDPTNRYLIFKGGGGEGRGLPWTCSWWVCKHDGNRKALPQPGSGQASRFPWAWNSWPRRPQGLKKSLPQPGSKHSTLSFSEKCAAAGNPPPKTCELVVVVGKRCSWPLRCRCRLEFMVNAWPQPLYGHRNLFPPWVSMWRLRWSPRLYVFSQPSKVQANGLCSWRCCCSSSSSSCCCLGCHTNIAKSLEIISYVDEHNILHADKNEPPLRQLKNRHWRRGTMPGSTRYESTISSTPKKFGQNPFFC